MLLKIFELISIVLLTLVSGMYWGPWLAITRSMAKFEPNVFLIIVNRLYKNMETLMTILLPLGLLSTIPVLIITFNKESHTFLLFLMGLILFVITLIVTIIIEVPIVKQIDSWTISTLPDNWQRLRDRWGRFHLLRIIPSIIGILLQLIAAIF